MHIAEVVTIAKSLPLLRLNTYKSLILSYSADYRRIFRKKLRISKIWIAMIVIIIVAVAAWLFSGSKNEEQIDFKQEAVTTQTLQNSVTATGTIEAVTSVTVGTQVSGIVNKLYVDYNSQVKKVKS